MVTTVQCHHLRRLFPTLRAAWKLYAAGCYGEALSTLHPLLQHTSLPPHTTSITRLLAAGCYTKLVTVYPSQETYCKSQEVPPPPFLPLPSTNCTWPSAATRSVLPAPATLLYYTLCTVVLQCTGDWVTLRLRWRRGVCSLRCGHFSVS